MGCRKILRLAITVSDIADNGTSLGPDTLTRCDCAVRHIFSWLRNHDSYGLAKKVFIFLPSGSRAGWSGEMTIASVMHSHLSTALGEVADECRFFVNYAKCDVKDIYQEVRWVTDRIDKHTYADFVDYEHVRYVTSPTQGILIRFIQQTLWPRDDIGDYVCSRESLMSLGRELRNYAAIIPYIFGLQSLANLFRRLTQRA